MCGAKVEPLFPSAYAQLCNHSAFPSILPSFITMLLSPPPSLSFLSLFELCSIAQADFSLVICLPQPLQIPAL